MRSSIPAFTKPREDKALLTKLSTNCSVVMAKCPTVPCEQRLRFCGMSWLAKSIQLFRERLSEKVRATIPKGIVGGFEFTVLQRNLKELA